MVCITKTFRQPSNTNWYFDQLGEACKPAKHVFHLYNIFIVVPYHLVTKTFETFQIYTENELSPESIKFISKQMSWKLGKLFHQLSDVGQDTILLREYGYENGSSICMLMQNNLLHLSMLLTMFLKNMHFCFPFAIMIIDTSFNKVSMQSQVLHHLWRCW